MTLGLISFIVSTFEYAIGLARGVQDIRQPEKPQVAGAEMTQAHAFAVVLNQTIHQIRDNFDTIRWPFTTLTTARTSIDAAASATSRFEQETFQLMPSSSAGGAVHSLTGGWPARWLTDLRVAQYFLEIIVGDRGTQDLQLLSDQSLEFTLTATPVVGEAVLIYEAVIGRTVVGGRSLSSTDRVAAGLGVLLPAVISYSIKTAARGASTALLVTRRAVVLAIDDLKVYKLMTVAGKLAKSVEIAVGLRALPESSFNELRGLLELVRRGTALSSSQSSRLNYFFVRMLDVSRLAQWLRIIEAELGTNATGLQKLSNVVFKPGEEEALTLLAKHSGQTVVALPETLPTDYPGKTAVSGVTYPDGVWNGEHFELRINETPNVDQEVRKIIGKQSQASRIVIAILGNSNLTKANVEAALPRVWGNTYYCSISEIAVLDASSLSVHARPDPFSIPFMQGLLRLGLGQPRALADMVKALQAEPVVTSP